MKFLFLKKLNLNLVLLSVILFSACSNDDNSNLVPQTNLQDLIVLTNNDNSEIFEQRIVNGALVSSANLTTDLGLPSVLERFDINFPFVSFIEADEAENDFNIYQKNIVSGQIFNDSDICSNLQNGALSYHPILSDNYIGIFYFEFNGNDFPDFYLRVLDKETGLCSVIFLGTGGFQAYTDTLVLEDILFLKIKVDDNEYKLLRIDLSTNVITNELSFNSNFAGVLNGTDMYLFFPDNSQQVYEVANLNLVSSEFINLDVTISNGLNKPQVNGEEVEVFIPYQQPSIFEGAPGTISLVSGDLIKGDGNYLFQVKETLELELSSAIDFTTFSIDIASNTVIYGYKKLSTTENNTGGIAYGNFEGEIFEIVELGQEPFGIIIN